MVQRLLAEDVRQRLGWRWSTHHVRLPALHGPETITLAAEAMTWTTGPASRTDSPRTNPAWTFQGGGECLLITRIQRTRACRPFAWFRRFEHGKDTLQDSMDLVEAVGRGFEEIQPVAKRWDSPLQRDRVSSTSFLMRSGVPLVVATP